MAGNPDAGNSITSVLGDYVLTVGDNANTYPSVHVEPTGQTINDYMMTSTGMQKIESALPTFRAIDNSGAFLGGSYVLTALNSIRFEAAGGGMDASVRGNISFKASGGMVNITSNTVVGVTSHLVQISSTNAVKINGPLFYVDTKETIFNKNVTFGNNVKINGGLAVNGELFARHITAMHSLAYTKESPELNGYPINGAEFAVQIYPQTPALTTPPMGINSPELIMGAMPPGNYIMRIIPYYPLKALAPDAIVSCPPHEHLYNSIGDGAISSPTEMMDKMKEVESDKPVEAKPTTIEGLSPTGLVERIGKKVEDRIIRFMKMILKLPF